MEVIINDRIRVRTVKFFNNFHLLLKHDSVASTFHFDYFFDPLNPDQAETACVSHYHEAKVTHLGETLVTGYILSQNYRDSSVKEMAKFAGYSKTGAFEDCQIDPSYYPLQFNGLSLKEIATKLIAPFKIKMVIDPSVASRMNIAYATTTAEPTQTIKDYLTELATQRNIIISHDSLGNLLFTQTSKTLKPLFHVEKGVIAHAMDLSFSGQPLHSQITVIKQADSDGGNASQYTIKNPYVPIVYRPKVITQSSGDDNSTKEVAQNALAAELKNIRLIVEIDRWDVAGKIIRPGVLISALNPNLYIYKKTNWFVESVEYVGNSKQTTATLTCVLPEVYNEQTPKNIFVDKHKNTGLI